MCVFFFLNPEKVTVVVMTTEVLEDGSGSLCGSVVQQAHQGCSVCGLRPEYLWPGSVGALTSTPTAANCLSIYGDIFHVALGSLWVSFPKSLWEAGDLGRSHLSQKLIVMYLLMFPL